ncbi:hypothetical protein Acy02nite_55350 [Actinoplanes cyaneus]|uniref:CHAT domain-containing protein n=1 Tax=Actinoplanes cyaneus TaxID=52696 RepID=A0A919M9L4_9ACTN|nr:hypothetical protein Acy02nite_55350 [Actinoplanes cyaneus]
MVTARRTRSPEDPGWTVVVGADSGTLYERTMPAGVAGDRWWPIPADSDPRTDTATFVSLTDLVLGCGDRSPDASDAITYGCHLLDSLLGDGEDEWDALRALLDTAEFPEIVLDFAADDTDLHRHHWELLHERGEARTFLALDTARPVLILRQVAASGSTRAAEPIVEVPRLLFGVGSRLHDAQIRAGTEVMGVIRGHHQGNGLLDVRVRPELTLNTLADQCRQFTPHVVHLIGHGSWRPELGRSTVDLRAERGQRAGADGAEAVDGSQLAWALRQGERPPLMVILSACELGYTEPARHRREPSEGEGANPMAAELVAAGIPVVVAMTGRISHLACRDFARALAQAVLEGRPLARATAAARMAAAYRLGSAEDRPLDWALPAVFVGPSVGVGFQVVDVSRTEKLRQFMTRFGFMLRPVFYGRDEFFDLLTDLLDPRRDLAILLAEAARGRERPGGTRLLDEFAAAGLRAGRIPCVVGPFARGREPRNAAQFALEIVTAIAKTRACLGLGAGFRSTVVEALWEEVPQPQRDTITERVRSKTDSLARRLRNLAGDADPDDLSAEDLGDYLREDLLALLRDVHREHPDMFPDDLGPMILIDNLHRFDAPFDYLSAMLDAAGLRAMQQRASENTYKIPVVMFTKDPAQRSTCGESRLTRAFLGSRYATTAELLLFPEMAERRGDGCHLAAWRTLLMSPTESTGELAKAWTVRAHAQAEEQWRALAQRQYDDIGDEEKEKIFSLELLRRIVKNGEHVLEADNDEALLAEWCSGVWSRS